MNNNYSLKLECIRAHSFPKKEAAFVSKKKPNFKLLTTLISTNTMKLKNRLIEIGLKIVIAALTAALTAITTTSCMGYGPVTL